MAARAGGNMEVEITAATLAPAAAIASISAVARLAGLWGASPWMAAGEPSYVLQDMGSQALWGTRLWGQ